jgi:hypothetical protein
MKVKATSLAAAILLSMIPSVSHAQEFSADVVYIATPKPVAPTAGAAITPAQSKLYVSKKRMRLETHGVTGTILLVNAEEHSVIALFPRQKSFQQLPSGPSEYFWVEDAEKACPDWEKASDQKINCEKVGHETVDGRQVVKYENKGASNAAISAVWIDPSLKFVIKWEGTGAGAELHNIREAPQAADLFTVPSAFAVLKPQKPSKGFSHGAK